MPKSRVAVKKAPGAKAPAKVAAKGKPAAKPPASAAKKPAVKPAPAAKSPVLKNVPPKPETKSGKPAGPIASAGKVVPARKGITIVSPRPAKREEKSTIQMPKFGAPLLRPGGPAPKPLIASGPGAARKPLHIDDGSKPKKSPFDKRELARFRGILLQKRAELIGDVSAMETQALQGSSGSLSHMPQHMAEQGTETFDQALSLDLAAADRRLIKEIEDAIKRIDDGTYGVCGLTGKPIKLDRLEELPWARYSIEAARELERRATMPQVP